MAPHLKVEAICRAICSFSRYDPDAPVMYGGGQEVVHGPFGSVVYSGYTQPAWTMYKPLAFEIMKKLEDSNDDTYVRPAADFQPRR